MTAIEFQGEKYDDVEFQVLQEPWNSYRLEDGALLLTKYVVTKLLTALGTPAKKGGLHVQGRNIAVVREVPEHLWASPSKPETLQTVLNDPSKQVDLDFEVESERWNKYAFKLADTNMEVRVRSNVFGCFRFPVFDLLGYPVYRTADNVAILVRRR